MPLTMVEPDMFMEHQDIEVFHTYPDGLYDDRSHYWFTTDPKTADDCVSHGVKGHFDVRLLTAQWSTTPNVKQWDDWWKARFRTEDEAVTGLIKWAIEEGRLPKETVEP